MNVEELPAIVSNPVAICAVHLHFYSCILTKASCGHIYHHVINYSLFRKDADRSFTNPLSCSGSRGSRAKDESQAKPGRRTCVVVRLRIALVMGAKFGHRAESDRAL